MSRVLVPGVSSSVCGVQNFTSQWTRYFGGIEFLDDGDEVGDEDVLVVDHFGGNPCKRFRIANGAKLVYVVHEVWEDMAGPLREASFLIYMSSLQESVAAKLLGIKAPNIVCFGHPYEDFGIAGRRAKAIYLGGWLKIDKADGLVGRMRTLAKQYPEYELRCYFILNDRVYLETLQYFQWRVRFDPVLDGRVKFFKADDFSFEEMKHNMAACEYAFLWRNEPTLQEVQELIEKGSERVLQVKIGDSGMLANAIGAGCKLIVEECSRFYTHLVPEGRRPTFRDFAGRVKEAVERVRTLPNPEPIFEVVSIEFGDLEQPWTMRFVTEKVRSLVRKNPRAGRWNRNGMLLSCNQNKFFGLSEGVSKSMRVVYRYNGVERMAVFPENMTVNVPYSGHEEVRSR